MRQPSVSIKCRAVPRGGEFETPTTPAPFGRMRGRWDRRRANSPFDLIFKLPPCLMSIHFKSCSLLSEDASNAFHLQRL
jgi:hypothetical protein